jgi:hypothetical protein
LSLSITNMPLGVDGFRARDSCGFGLLGTV